MMMSSNIEFYLFEHEVWYRKDGAAYKLTEGSQDVLSMFMAKMENFYPEAFEALKGYYKKSMPNMAYYRFLIVRRFIKCNFAIIDNVHDLTSMGELQFEHVPCPMRGECRLEGIVCAPKYEHRLSDSELRVMKLWCEGLSKEDIAEKLFLSVHTVNNHIRNSYARVGVHEKAEFWQYAERHHLFGHVQ